MAKNRNYYVNPKSPVAGSVNKLLDEFYEACGSTRLGVIRFVRGMHHNFYYDYLKDKTGKWPAVNDQVWQTFNIYEFIYRAFMGSQRAGWKLIDRYRNS